MLRRLTWNHVLFLEAAASRVKFLCFPEVFSFIGSKEGESVKLAEPLDGPIMQRYCSLAKLVKTKIGVFILIFHICAISM